MEQLVEFLSVSVLFLRVYVPLSLCVYVSICLCVYMSVCVSVFLCFRVCATA